MIYILIVLNLLKSNLRLYLNCDIRHIRGEKTLKERIIVLAKTYPELSKKYGPIVCVAGVNEYGEWRRLYPIPYEIWINEKYKNIRFRKWDIIEVTIKKATHDHRKESMRVQNWEQIRIIGHVEDWGIRKHIINELLDPNLESIIDSGKSLGVIQPKKILDFYVKTRKRLDEAEKLVIQKMEEADSTLFKYSEPENLSEVRRTMVKIEELPWIGYRFYCKNPECKGHDMMVIDWEAQELFRKYKTKIDLVRKKLFTWMIRERDLYFIVGNVWRFPKSFMIIGLFYPPKKIKPQTPLFSSSFFMKRSKTLFDFNKRE